MLRGEPHAEDMEYVCAKKVSRVLFPGALNSEFTNTMHFIRPSTHKAIPTYRVMDQYGQVLDKETRVDTEDEEALKLYRNMVCCMFKVFNDFMKAYADAAVVSIMDLLMFEAQRQGRLSFYMVCPDLNLRSCLR